MLQTITIYRKVIAWEEEVHVVSADSKEDALEIARSIKDDPHSVHRHSFAVRGIMEDRIRYSMDASDWQDISYEIAIDGRMTDGGGRFGDKDFDNRRNRPQ
jgi:hypothetical protein